MKKKNTKAPRFNPVAKHAHKFNKAIIIDTSKRNYKRKPKFRNRNDEE